MNAILRVLAGFVLSLSAAAAFGQSCTPNTPRSDTGAGFTPFGATEMALGRGGQSGPSWEWAVGPDAGGSQQVQGSLDWASGKVYDWSVSYNGAGSATLQVRDAGTLVLNLTYPSAMDAGNTLKFHVSTNPAIGSDTTISAAISQISGNAVTGSISQTGNNTQAEQNTYFFFPGMSSGFTAAGTVSLTYASLPAGSKVQFYVQSGTIACTGGNNPPTVSISAPAANSVFNATATIAVGANAADSDGSVTQVQFFANGNPIGTATSAPFAINWAGVAAGNYSLTAVATDNGGTTTTSSAVPVIVNSPPSVSLSSPTPGATFNAPATIVLAANASDSDGTVTQVQFFDGATPLGTVSSAPYTLTLTGVAAGAHNYSAVATDNRGATSSSSVVAVSVNALPAVSITAPAANAVFNSPATVTVTASANDTDGTITQVQFFANGNSIGTATGAPFSVSWSGMAAGTYNLTAAATDNSGAITISAAVPVIVNTPPTVSLTSPAAGATYNAPATIVLTANAADSDGTVTQVQFFDGVTAVGTVTSAPFTLTLSNVAAGGHSYTAVATDDRNATTTSAAVAVTVNATPTVSITAPAAGAVFNSPATIAVTANASDTDGTVTQVQFFANGNPIGTSAASPFTISWSGMATGTYSLTAVATDSSGATTTSAAVSIRVNAPPSVSVTGPVNGATFTAPALIPLSATAADADGTIASVSFYRGGSTLIATVNTPPFNYQWTGVTAGPYSITAVATDNDGASTTSAPVMVTVSAPVAQLYFIHPDHLNTPRLVADSNQNTVWKWDNQEPFGNDTPNNDPGSTNNPFSFNLRFPGQYSDTESNLAYNVARDYDAGTGRYIQSDPTGLTDGPSTYSYVWSDPISGVDPSGLSVFKIIKLCKDGYKVLRKADYKDAVRAARRGDDVLAPNSQQASQVARAASGGAGKPTRNPPHQPGQMPHYHPNPRTGAHVFYQIAGALTVSHYVSCTDCTEATLAAVVDFFNPLAAPQDIIDILSDD